MYRWDMNVNQFLFVKMEFRMLENCDYNDYCNMFLWGIHKDKVNRSGFQPVIDGTPAIQAELDHSGYLHMFFIACNIRFKLFADFTSDYLADFLPRHPFLGLPGTSSDDRYSFSPFIDNSGFPLKEGRECPMCRWNL